MNIIQQFQITQVGDNFLQLPKDAQILGVFRNNNAIMLMCLGAKEGETEQRIIRMLSTGQEMKLGEVEEAVYINSVKTALFSQIGDLFMHFFEIRVIPEIKSHIEN